MNKGHPQVDNISTVIYFLVVGSLLGLATYSSFFSQSERLSIKWIIGSATFFIWFFSFRKEQLSVFSQISGAFFSVAFGLLLSHYYGTFVREYFGFALSTIQGIALAKFGESLPIIFSMLTFQFLTRRTYDEIFVLGGNTRKSMLVGTIGFIGFGLVAAGMAFAKGIDANTIKAALFWSLLFIFSNALLEELWFRSIFLGRLKSMIGPGFSILVTSLVFASVHISSTYVKDISIFIGLLLVLGSLWAWLMLKTKSIWGAVIFHAGADILVIIGFLSGTLI